MTLAADIYLELDRAGLAPSLPFCAAPDVWRAAILRAVGDTDDELSQLHWTMRDAAVLEDTLSTTRAELTEALKDRDAWKQKYEAVTAKDSK